MNKYLFILFVISVLISSLSFSDCNFININNETTEDLSVANHFTLNITSYTLNETIINITGTGFDYDFYSAINDDVCNYFYMLYNITGVYYSDCYSNNSGHHTLGNSYLELNGTYETFIVLYNGTDTCFLNRTFFTASFYYNQYLISHSSLNNSNDYDNIMNTGQNITDNNLKILCLLVFIWLGTAFIGFSFNQNVFLILSSLIGIFTGFLMFTWLYWWLGILMMLLNIVFMMYGFKK
jgi:hypothetical protein